MSQVQQAFADAATWHRDVRTRDGVPYRIRPIEETDRERERAFILGLSDESRYRRFLIGMREPSDALVEQFVHVDYHHSMAFVATEGEGDHESFIGIARYAPDDTRNVTEFAVTVADAWQGRGVATELLTLLISYARSRCLARLTGWALKENDAMLDLAHAFEMRVRPAPGDATLVEIEVSLDPPAMPGSTTCRSLLLR